MSEREQSPSAGTRGTDDWREQTIPGIQPVSAWSFSSPTRSAMTSVTPGRSLVGVVTISRSSGQ